MKKNIFIILISTLFILILMYFYDKREEVINKQYNNQINHIHIEYPYFHNTMIDTYINNYLSSYMNSQSREESLFIDYDYLEENQKVNLTMYIYETNGNIITENKKHFDIDILEGTIQSSSGIVGKFDEYDGFYQKVMNKEKPMVALTFDDGPNHNTIKILNILEKYGVKATFFILGGNVKGNEKTIVKMNELGMEIGNHMYSHKLLTKLSNDEIKEEIKKVDQLIFDIIGRYPSLVRPSYGTYNKRIKSVIDRPIVIWNVDTLDWKYHNSKRIFKRVMKSVSDGDIILMHDIYNATANSLELVIPELLEQGYQFVTVSELLYYKGIGLEEGKVYSNAN